MFALEVSFNDGVSQPEMIFIRRPQALIGSSDHAHVVIDDLKSLNYQVRVVRDLGRKFRLVPSHVQATNAPAPESKIFEGEGALEVGPVRFYFTALDSDLLPREAEPPDRAGVRVLRQSASTVSPLFPAVVVNGTDPMVVSFVPDQPIFIGRSRQCPLRLDSADVSAKHARMGYESGEFWIEDLGSTNGTFVNQQQISGRVNVPASTPIVIGREISILGVTSEDQIARASQSLPEIIERPAYGTRQYPIAVSASEIVRPARIVLVPGASISIGRDPTSDMWLGAPHVSRRHCAIALEPHGSRVIVTDHSTNGTAYDGGILHRGETLPVEESGTVLDFGSGVTVGICFSEDEESRFLNSPTTNKPQNGSELAESEPNETQGEVESPQSELYPDEEAPKQSLFRRAFELFRTLHVGGRVLIIITIVTVLAAGVIAASLLLGFMRA